MPIDHKEHDYHALDLPNIQVEVHKGVTKTQSTRLTFDRRINLLVMRVAKARPSWTITLPGGWYADTTHVSEEFVVYQNKEELGRITLSATREGEPYVIQNTRIDAKRKRGKGLITKDLNKAVKLILTNFHPKSVLEQVDDLKKQVGGCLNKAEAQSGVDFSNAQNHLANAFTNSLNRDFAQAREYLQDKVTGAAADALRDYPEMREVHKQLSKMVLSYRNTTSGVFVVLSGTDYYVYNRPTDTYNSFTTDELEPWIKRSLGLLKLLGENEVMEDVGVKVDEFSYYLVDNSPKDKKTDA